MYVKGLATAFAAILAAAQHTSAMFVEDHNDEEQGQRGLTHGNGCKQGNVLALKFTNLTPGQVFAPQFFVAVHNRRTGPFYEIGEHASDGLELLAEDGVAGDLAAEFAEQDGVASSRVAFGGAPPGRTVYININDVSRGSRLFSFGVMAVNTNDAFVGLNGARARVGRVYYLNGLDAGTEVNDELCDNIPGPACGDMEMDGEDETNDFGPDGLGFVHVHTGVHGVADLDPTLHDWRNPMARVEVVCVPEEDTLPFEQDA